MKPYATLISFGTGDIYARYLQAMFATAEHHFFPGRAQLLELDTTPGWPLACRDRHTHILKARKLIRGRFVMLLDADLLFEGPVDDEIVADGITACLHPVLRDPREFTYERDERSPAYIPEGEGERYYVGGIIGGTRAEFLDLSRQVDRMCKADGDWTPIWQDESYVNRILLDQPPALELDERYCAWFNHDVPDARIRALNKTDAEMRWRHEQPSGREAAVA